MQKQTMKQSAISKAQSMLCRDYSAHLQREIDRKRKETFCHHCGKQIVFNRTYPDAANSHWAHAIRVFNGKAHSLENALMEQRCSDGIHWATPKRKAA